MTTIYRWRQRRKLRSLPPRFAEFKLVVVMNRMPCTPPPLAIIMAALATITNAISNLYSIRS